MVKILKHKGYTYWQSTLTWLCYLFDDNGVWIGIYTGQERFKGKEKMTKSDARYAIEDMLYRKELGLE